MKATNNPDKLTLSSRYLAIRFCFRESMSATVAVQAAGRLKELTLVDQEGIMVKKGRASSFFRHAETAESRILASLDVK